MRATIAGFAVLCLGACSVGVRRPLGKCADDAERRPVNPQRWPGGIKQLQAANAAKAIETAPLEAPAAAPAVSRPVASPPRPLAPPVAAKPEPSMPAPVVPGTLEINPVTPSAGQRASLSAEESVCHG